MHLAISPSKSLFMQCTHASRRLRSWSALGAALLLAPTAMAEEPAPQGLTGHLIREVKRAKVIELSHTWDENSPVLALNPPYAMSLPFTHANTRGTFGDGGQLSFTSDGMQWSGQHGAPSIDAVGHIGHDGLLYGGVDAEAATSDPRGLGRSGVGAELAIDQYPMDLLVNRGVLLDVARFVMGNSQPLPAGFEITSHHLRQTAAFQRVHLQPGDTVFIRTGWGQHFKGDPELYKGVASPGPGLDAAQYLLEKGARVVGADTLTFEKRPATVYIPQLQVFPVHLLLVPDNGIYIIENVQLEDLSAARAYEFVAVVPPLKVLGATGSALRAFALVDRHGR
ncbi:cyclase family protein [Hyalangium gracile]|uniref:cyclase family protein n=1 Tax=Hyalangium gracile TaxID=394092 RepID=UPI001CCBB661|nr:cyclase family protein [Hyalangium gracile]